MSQTTHKLFWFRLRNKDGQKFPDTSETSIELPPSADVNDFCDKVKEEFPNKLDGVDAYEFKVFEN